MAISVSDFSNSNNKRNSMITEFFKMTLNFVALNNELLKQELNIEKKFYKTHNKKSTVTNI